MAEREREGERETESESERERERGRQRQRGKRILEHEAREHRRVVDSPTVLSTSPFGAVTMALQTPKSMTTTSGGEAARYSNLEP